MERFNSNFFCKPIAYPAKAVLWRLHSCRCLKDVIKRSLCGVTKRARSSLPSSSTLKRASPKVPKSYPSGATELADPSYSFSSTTARCSRADFIPSRTTRPSHIMRYFGYQSFLSWSPYRQDLWGPARPQRVSGHCWLAGRKGGEGREIYFDEVGEACRATTPRRLNFDTFANNVYVYRCVVLFVICSSPPTFSLLRMVYNNNTIYHETRFETSPLTLERRFGSLKMSFLKFISVRSMQAVVPRPRQRLNHGSYRYFHMLHSSSICNNIRLLR